MSDPCTFPGCGKEKGGTRHVISCGWSHPPDLYCHLFQSAREPKAGGVAANETVNGPASQEPSSPADNPRADQAEETLARIEEEARLSAGTFTGDLLRALLDGKSVRSKAWMERRGRE